MKTGIITLILLFFGLFAFSQDLLGLQVPEIQKTTKGVRGIQIQFFGDSSLWITNKLADRYFTFKIDPATQICFEEEVQLSKNDFENIHILNRYLNLGKSDQVSFSKEDTIYQTNLKTIQIKHEGESIRLVFKSKISPTDLMAIINDNENN